jgi:two-component system, NarL family, invasion response regulator UvrY
MKNKRIILADDHIVIRNGLKALIEKLGPYEVVAEFDNGRQLVEGISSLTDVDLLIMDITMPEMDGDEALQALNQKGIKIPVLILTLSQDDDRMVRLFRMGARAYLQKSCSADTMQKALEEIFRVGYYHNEFLAASLQKDSVPGKSTDPSMKILQQLTDRERQFLKLVCHEKEYTYDQIAGIMGVQHRTVDGYRESIFEKFAIKSKTGLVLFVLKNRLMDSL